MAVEIDKIWLLRIIHINNVEYILRNGMFTRNHPLSDPDYINIGDSHLIEQRNDYPVSINPPNGTLGEYIPFYFGAHSPMLLNIKTGYRGITRRPQSDIVYICCKFTSIKKYCPKWCFTDGHSKNVLTRFFNTEDNFNEVDWSIVHEQYWHNTEDDFDRMRRKQAEFLVKDHVPVHCFDCIVVFNVEKRNFVQGIIDEIGLDIKVKIDTGNKFYY